MTPAAAARERLRRGDLAGALASLQDEVRKHAADAKLRVFLFQLLAVVGAWQRALAQLQVAGELDAGTLAMVQTYREAIRCEVLRRQVFAGKRAPLVLGRPEPWVGFLTEALRLVGEGRAAEADELRGRAFEEASATPGMADTAPFAWIGDADMRLGPIFELIIDGKYYWVPATRFKRLAFEAPSDLRDVVWLPAQITWVNGGEAVGLMPVRYPGSEDSARDPIRLARETAWAEPRPGRFEGLGQRMLATDAGEYPILELRELLFLAEGEGDGRAHSA